MSTNVLVTSRSFGTVTPEPLDILRRAGLSVTRRGADFRQEEFERILPEYDALIIGAHPLPEDVLAACPRLRLICKHGAGVDNIPLEACRRQDVAVCNVVNTNSDAVADLAFGFMLALARGILRADRSVHDGAWKTVTGVDVCGKTLGLYGFGAISRCVARRARGFSMKVLAHDAYLRELPEEFRDYVRLVPLDEMVSSCNFLSVHLPLNDETRRIVDKRLLDKMKSGAFLINTCRGGVVCETDLYEALVSGRLAGAALDVSEIEPMPPDDPLRRLENVIITPHIGMYSREAMGAVSLICAKNTAAFFQGGELISRIV